MATDRDEWQRRADYHLRTGNEYAEESHQWEGEVGDGYSALAEAHHHLAKAFAKKAGLQTEPE